MELESALILFLKCCHYSWHHSHCCGCDVDVQDVDNVDTVALGDFVLMMVLVMVLEMLMVLVMLMVLMVLKMLMVLVMFKMVIKFFW